MRTPFIDPGALRSELALQVNTPAPDGLGGHAESWAEIATVFAQDRAGFGDEQLRRRTRRWRR